MTAWLKALLVLLLVPTQAIAGIAVRAEVGVGGSAPVLVTKTFEKAHEEDPSTSTAFVDDAGNQCQILLNVESVDAEKFVVMKVRCLDSRGRVVLQQGPNMLVKDDDEATMSVGEGEQEVSVRVLVTTDHDSEEPTGIRRDFFAQSKTTTYPFFGMKRSWQSLSCEEGDFSVMFRGIALTSAVHGRFRAGDVLRTECTAQTQQGAVAVPVTVSFF